MSSLAKALLAFQSEPPAVHFDATNPHFRNKYATLGGVVDAVRPALAKVGIVYTQLPTTVDGRPALRTVLTHADSGESIEDTMLLVLDRDNSQGQGSALTYARRYALLSALGLVADEDDDANTASRQSVGETAGGNGAGSSRLSDGSPATHFQAPPGAAEPAGDPDDDGQPGNVRVHFGKNTGSTLGEMTDKQRRWYAETWAPDGKFPVKPEDRRLRQAARILCGVEPVRETGGPFDPDGEIPF